MLSLFNCPRGDFRGDSALLPNLGRFVKFLLIDEACMCVRSIQVMGFGLFLLDGKEVSIYKLENRRKINLTKIDKIFKVRAVCPCCFAVI